MGNIPDRAYKICFTDLSMNQKNIFYYFENWWMNIESKIEIIAGPIISEKAKIPTVKNL